MATILAHITVKPGCAARFEQIAAELYRATHDHEPNVRRYEYWRGAEPDTYYTLLSYDTFAEFIEHVGDIEIREQAGGAFEVQASMSFCIYFDHRGGDGSCFAEQRFWVYVFPHSCEHTGGALSDAIGIDLNDLHSRRWQTN